MALTGVLVGGDNEPEAIVGFAVGISGVVQRQKVALRVDDARFGASAPAAEVSLRGRKRGERKRKRGSSVRLVG